MNEVLQSKNNVGTWLFSPFTRIAGWTALVLGVGAILAAGLIGSVSKTHFDGVLDTHSGLAAPLWVFLAEGLINWLCLAVVLWLAGRLAGKSSFRALDLFATQALARWPTLFIALATLLPGYQRFGAELMRQYGLAAEGAAPQAADAAAFGFAVVVMLVVIVWMVALMYRSYRFVCNLPLGRAVTTFIVGLLIAEVASKAVLVPVYLQHAPQGMKPAAAAPAQARAP